MISFELPLQRMTNIFPSRFVSAIDLLNYDETVLPSCPLPCRFIVKRNLPWRENRTPLYLPEVGDEYIRRRRKALRRMQRKTISDSINHSCALSLRYPWMPLELPPKIWKVLVKGPLASKKAKSLLSLVIKALTICEYSDLSNMSRANLSL